MYRYSDHWLKYAGKYEDNLSENLEADDFTLKGSFQFYKDFLKFTGRRTFVNVPRLLGTGEKLTSSGSWSLEGKLSNNSWVNVNHNESGDGSIETELHLWENQTKTNTVRCYERLTSDLVLNKQVIYNHGPDYMFNIGIKEWSLKNENGKWQAPDTFSLGALTRIRNDATAHMWGGIQLGLGTKSIFKDVSALFGYEAKNLSGFALVGIERKVEEQLAAITDVNPIVKITHPKLLRIGIESEINPNLTLSLLSSTTFENNEVSNESHLGGLYRFDPSTYVKFRVSDNLTAALSLTRRYRNLFDFTFVGNFSWRRGIKTEETTTLSHIGSRFGLSITVLDEYLI